MNKELREKIESLIKLDIDAAESYSEALEHIDDPQTHQRIEEFRLDHEDHIRKLSEVLSNSGEAPPERKKDIKGYFIKGFTSMRSSSGEEGALKAMKSNEELTNKKYDKARSKEMTPAVKAIIEKNYEDERRHLDYIEAQLAKL